MFAFGALTTNPNHSNPFFSTPPPLIICDIGIQYILRGCQKKSLPNWQQLKNRSEINELFMFLKVYFLPHTHDL